MMAGRMLLSLLQSFGGKTFSLGRQDYGQLHVQNPHQFWNACGVGIPPVLKDAMRQVGTVWEMDFVANYKARQSSIKKNAILMLLISCSQESAYDTSNEET
jgi:hypothetical protein